MRQRAGCVSIPEGRDGRVVATWRATSVGVGTLGIIGLSDGNSGRSPQALSGTRRGGSSFHKRARWARPSRLALRSRLGVRPDLSLMCPPHTILNGPRPNRRRASPDRLPALSAMWAATRTDSAMSTPKRHHFLPRFYLERFCHQGFLQVYDREQNAFRRQAPINTAVIKDYYSFAESDGQKNVEIERLLAVLEGDAKTAIEKLDRQEELTQADREAVAMFVTLLQSRVPDFEEMVDGVVGNVAKLSMKESFATLERARASLAEYERSTGEPLGVTPERMMEVVHGDGYELEVHRLASLAMMLRHLMEIAPIVLGLEWTVVHTPAKKSLVTSDAPFMIFHPPYRMPAFYGVGILTPGAAKFVPLGARIGLLLGDPGEGIKHMSLRDTMCRALNLAVTAGTSRFVFARDERLLRNLVETTKLATQPRVPRVGFR